MDYFLQPKATCGRVHHERANFMVRIKLLTPWDHNHLRPRVNTIIMLVQVLL